MAEAPGTPPPTTAPAAGVASPDPAPTTSPSRVVPAVAIEPAQQDDPVEADEGSSYTASLSSSVIDYPEEYGRRYHAFRPGSYSFPNDEVEMERLDMAHAMMVRAIGSKLWLAPLAREKIHRILDIGTGTGIWAVEIGDIFENAEVIGNDLSAIQPEWVPPNVKFEIDDVESEWVGVKKYDFIMCRYMAASIQDWPKLIANVYDNLNPGGWAEFQDMSTEYYSDDGSYKPEHATYEWNQTFVETLDKIGRDPRPGPKLEGWVRGHGGFEHVAHHKFKTPIGPWARHRHFKDQGLLNLAQILEGLEGFSLKLLCGVLGRSKEEVLVQLAESTSRFSLAHLISSLKELTST
ncbi:methyltransferase [Colletotrichum simmondsii]|uniref:Methyltransferase n=1 Tax=Colletotrichum simmondsii TaxID=703756 RepID=A0A135TJR5_9PEZI|nr:methyltransferase [Colletotrichum simmondsii]